MKLYWLRLLLISLVCVGAHADDTEIYLGNPNATTAKPNIIFIFDTSGSMNTEVASTPLINAKASYCVSSGWFGCNKYGWKDVERHQTRLEVSREAAIDTIQGLSGVNLALMEFNYTSGGRFVLPMKPLDFEYPNGSSGTLTHKEKIIDEIKDLTAVGATPMVESVHEAYLYLTGGDVKHPINATNYKRIPDLNRYGYTDTYRSGDNHSGVLKANNNKKYTSPITDSCQKNHIVLFTDGASTSDGGSDSDIQNLLKNNFSQSDLADTGLSVINGSLCDTNNTNTEGNKTETSCLKDIAYIMNNTDAAPQLRDSISTVQLHTIGGFIGKEYQAVLDKAAELGGGISANAQNYEELKTALQKLFDNIVQSGGTFAAPAVSVNAFNSLEQLDQMYYSVFKPHEAVGWSGNVKRFRMAGDKIVDANGNNAIDPDTGFFSAAAQSFWTPDNQAPDGDNVTKGGMASRLQDGRKVVSNINSNNLMNENNRITPSNVTQQLLGTHLKDASFDGFDIDPEDPLPGDNDSYETNEFTKLVQWIGGQSKTDATKSRRSMEDPLHSTPVLLNYGELTIDGKKVPDSTLYIGTNSGYLHAFDTNENNPKERFAFIPKELLPVATKYYENSGKKKYGLDGHISVWHDDTNKDMIINNGEKAYLYVGMRRGGSSYYALDVSDRDNPKLKWQINGKNHQNGPTPGPEEQDPGPEEQDPGFEELGQTWSKMLPVDIKWNGVKTKALIFAGGYDITEDSNSTRKTHSVGNAIYMVDAENGELLWKASKTGANLNIAEMTSAITGDIVPVDDNSDGFVDLLYVADLGGRIFRIDFDQDESNANNYATGGMIADLGKNNSQSENVRFFDTLDVVYSKEFSYVEGDGSSTKMINDKPRYMLSIGSGYRAHPLNNDAKDNFYVLFDYNTNGPEVGDNGEPIYSSVKKSDLQGYKFTGRNLDITPTKKSNNGFYVKLISANDGEKVLSSSLTLNNTIYFTSFRPSDGTLSSSCTSDTGQSRLYQINLKPGDSTQVKVQDLNVPGIPPKPVLIVPKPPKDGGEHEDPKLLISTELIDTEGSRYPLKKTYWRELDE